MIDDKYHATITCARCGSQLGADGRCSDETCPFSDYAQNDPRGWSNHPDAEVCGGTGRHDGQSAACCDECCAEAERAAAAGAPCAVHYPDAFAARAEGDR